MVYCPHENGEKKFIHLYGIDFVIWSSKFVAELLSHPVFMEFYLPIEEPVLSFKKATNIKLIYEGGMVRYSGDVPNPELVAEHLLRWMRKSFLTEPINTAIQLMIQKYISACKTHDTVKLSLGKVLTLCQVFIKGVWLKYHLRMIMMQ